MVETLKWFIRDFASYANKTLSNEVGWVEWPSGDDKSAEEKLTDIEREAAQKIKALLIDRAKQLFGDKLPKLVGFEVVNPRSRGVKVRMDSAGIEVADNDLHPEIRYMIAKGSKRSLYDYGKGHHKLVLLSDGLYIFDTNQGWCIWETKREATQDHYLIFGQAALKAMKMEEAYRRTKNTR